jgi:hypothetical protein
MDSDVGIILQQPGIFSRLVTFVADVRPLRKSADVEGGPTPTMPLFSNLDLSSSLRQPKCQIGPESNQQC